MQSSAVAAAAAAAAGMTPRLVRSLSRLLLGGLVTPLVALDKLEDNRLATAAECVSCLCVWMGIRDEIFVSGSVCVHTCHISWSVHEDGGKLCDIQVVGASRRCGG
jgi:hypothetical protein